MSCQALTANEFLALTANDQKQPAFKYGVRARIQDPPEPKATAAPQQHGY